jgi:serine/threonine protein kinase
MIGTKLAHYEITSHLGSGGMGDVYQATDEKLGRSVAIKFLPEAFSHDRDRVARFQREARVLASLNHSNIAAIYGVEEIDSRHFLVMELVTGETLADRIKRGAIPIEEGCPWQSKLRKHWKKPMRKESFIATSNPRISS